jgi:hypothetical protein
MAAWRKSKPGDLLLPALLFFFVQMAARGAEMGVGEAGLEPKKNVPGAKKNLFI